MQNNQKQFTVALLPCNNLFEDFFDTINVSFETFRTELTGSWMFNYADALQKVGVRTVLFFVSARVSKVLYFTHEPTGAKVCVLPAPPFYRFFRNSPLWELFLKLEKIRELGYYKRRQAYLLMPLLLLAKELKQEGCNLILFQDYESSSFDVCVLLGSLLRLPIFATFQGCGMNRIRLERFIRPLAFDLCQGFIIGSQVEAQRIQEACKVPSNKVKRIVNPVDLATWYPLDRSEVRAELNIPIEARVVIFHGRIDIVHKGLDILMDAWYRVCQDRVHKDLRLLLVGTGDDAEKLRSLIETMQLRGVIWINEFVHDRTQLRRYISAADVYALASRYEGFPVAPIEAMACGLPVVAAAAPGITDILEYGEASGGLVVPREDAESLALALGRVIDNEVWGREMGVKARQHVIARFSLEAVGKQLYDYFFEHHIDSKQNLLVEESNCEKNSNYSEEI